MKKKASTLNYQIKTIIIKAFSEIGNDLGDMLYDIENMTSNNQRDTKIEQKNNALVKELDMILTNSYKKLFFNINVALKSKGTSKLL